HAAVVAASRSGGAVAMPYHHPILPLSPRRDKLTEVRWGIADFKRRFGRDPEGMWLPETAVDDETLDVVAGEGIRFTILAPHQVERAPAGGLPGWYRTSGGRRIAVFIYNGAISHDVAFGPLVRDADAWIERLTAGSNQLVAVATDGETYGHHHKHGDAVLARVLETLRRRGDVRVESFGTFLARQEPEEDVRPPLRGGAPRGGPARAPRAGAEQRPRRGVGAGALPHAGEAVNPVGFVFGVHLHQPVGNFDHVFQEHLRDVYRPLVERLAERRFFPFTLHLSGPLLAWLEAHDAAYLDLIG